MLPDINLLPKYKRERSLLYILFLAGLILAILFTGFLGYQYITVHNELKETNEQNKELTKQKETLQVQTAEQESNQKEAMREAVAYAEKYVIPTSKLIDQLMTFLPTTGYMSQYNYNEGEVVIESHFETMTDASSYMAKLNASDFIKNPIVNRLETFELEAPEANADSEDEADNQAELSIFELLPRYQVTYSFEINPAQLKKETEENE
ncbi:hypothetical protein QNH23_00060 [Siminovitchia fortis]|uniref:Uncharacterized protein n=1 Tax=Siminovitchia fortis TaxID=254758 RepID=A0A443IUR5_9BACI|nr:hypothetical protein [Siminovitchia fortis]RWR11857.1 hypothetical protein D4N35_007925 [Siminovitchia fortis]WHY81863.1 hypothetical protein QNH23_00060 [Siminovitchia fortis]